MKQEKIQSSEKKVEKLSEEINNESKKIIKEKEKIKNGVEELKKQLEESKKLAEERLNQIKYLRADIDNLRKRFEKEKAEVIKSANDSLIKELLVVLDAFDAAIKISEGESKKGLLMLEKKFFDILVEHGLEEIEAIGKQFNPNFHEALCNEFSKKQDNEVIEVIQKGYTLNFKVIRTSKVKVSKGLKKQDRIENNKEN